MWCLLLVTSWKSHAATGWRHGRRAQAADWLHIMKMMIENFINRNEIDSLARTKSSYLYWIESGGHEQLVFSVFSDTFVFLLTAHSVLTKVCWVVETTHFILGANAVWFSCMMTLWRSVNALRFIQRACINPSNVIVGRHSLTPSVFHYSFCIRHSVYRVLFCSVVSAASCMVEINESASARAHLRRCRTGRPTMVCLRLQISARRKLKGSNWMIECGKFDETRHIIWRCYILRSEGSETTKCS